MKTYLIVRSIALAVLLLCSSLVSAQQLEERARAVLQKLELGAEWRPGFQEEQRRWGGVSLTSTEMSFSFHGPSREFTSFQWGARMTEIRNRGQYRGTAFRTDDQLKAKARALLARLRALDDTWQVKGSLDADDPRVGGQQEFQGGGVGVEFGRVVNGLTAINHGAMVWFDSKDGKPVYVAINDRNTTFGSAAGMMSATAAEARAREHATEYLTRRLPAEDAERLIGGFPDPAHTPVELVYGSVDEGLDGVTEPYASRRETPPEYVVNLGSVTVLIHAVTGECLGGGVTQSASPTPQARAGVSRDTADVPHSTGQGGFERVVASLAILGGLGYALYRLVGWRFR